MGKNQLIPFISNTGLLASQATSGTYQVAMGILPSYLSQERVNACLEDLQLIDEIESTLTIEALSIGGGISKKDELLCKRLLNYEISPNRMTIDEARLVHEYVSNATEEIVNEKVARIVDLLTNILNGKKQRRDYGFDKKKSEILMRLIEKGMEYEDGNFDLSRGFDHTVYPSENGYDEDSGYSVIGHEISRQEFENLLEVMTDEELLDGDYIHEEDFFKFGPYTIRDLRHIATFASETWARATDQRNRSRLESLLEDLISPHDCLVEADVNRNYIANLVLPTRRPYARNMIALLSSLGQACNDVIFSNKSTLPEEIEEDVKQLKESLQLCSYYASMICGLTTKYVKATYKVARPITSDYYKEILSKSDSWPSDRTSRIETDYGVYLIKLDDHMFEAQATYVKIMSRLKHSASNNAPSSLPQLPNHN